MKNDNEKRSPRITLKQYLHSNSLRKKASSKCSSKDYSYQKGTPRHIHHEKGIQPAPIHFAKETSKQQLLEHIKVKLAEMILKDQDLVAAIKLIDQLICRYRDELARQIKDNEVLLSLLQEKKGQNKPHTPSQHSKQSRVLVEDNCFTTPFEDHSFQSVYSGHLGVPQQQNTRLRLNSQSLDDIPNINILLQTRNKDQLCSQADQQTKETVLPKRDGLRATNSQGSTELYAFDSFGSDLRKRKSSVNQNLSHFLQTDRFGKCQDEPSQIRISLRSSIWNNMDTRTSRNVFEQNKHSLKG